MQPLPIPTEDDGDLGLCVLARVDFGALGRALERDPAFERTVLSRWHELARAAFPRQPLPERDDFLASFGGSLRALARRPASNRVALARKVSALVERLASMCGGRDHSCASALLLTDAVCEQAGLSAGGGAGWGASACGLAAPPPTAAPPEAAEAARQVRFCSLVGASPAMRRIFAQVQLAAQERGAVLVAGESGTGKELVARAIHLCGGGKPERFVPVNCAALSSGLIESELFGHVKGAFSGADEARAGLFQEASGGTLFLDEITELPGLGQAKLLRALQEGAIRPVGQTRELAVDVRVIASTNRPLGEAVASGRLRRDLFYRLQEFVIEIPPLRDRLEDIPLIAEEFLRLWSEEHPAARRTALDRAATRRLESWPWPGNVRELRNVLFAACRTANGPVVREQDVAPWLRDLAASPVAAATSLRGAEKEAVRRALDSAGGNKSLASRILGISRKNLYAKIREFAIDPADGEPPV